MGCGKIGLGLHKRSASGSCTAGKLSIRDKSLQLLEVWLEYANGRTGRLFHKDAQREIFVPVNELEVVLVIGEQCRPDPARAQRNKDVVQKGREL